MKLQNNLENFNIKVVFCRKKVLISAIFQFLIKKSAFLYPPLKRNAKIGGGIFSVIFIYLFILLFIYIYNSIVLINLLSL